MKSEMLVKLQKLNTTLSAASWCNYQEFLRIVLSSYPPEVSGYPLQCLAEGRFSELLDWADGLASTVFRTPSEHRMYHQFASLIRKYPFPEKVLNRDPDRRAIDKFKAAEHTCSRVNKRFLCYRKVRSPNEELLARARSFISYVLGNFSLNEVWGEAAFGAGASIDVHGNCTNLARKLLSESWTVTPGAYYYAQACLKEDIHIVELLNSNTHSETFFSVDAEEFNRSFAKKARVITHNKISFVPKDATTSRSIATEPLLNGYLQKGLDQVMRKRLKRVGIDLSDQQRNQQWARKGSAEDNSDDAFATIDLSSASDSVSIELCRDLLPPEWYAFMDAIRSHEYKLNGALYRYHKFASMGNGFCFPLESLIFASLCHAVRPDSDPHTDFLVYGDDIVVRRSMFAPLVSLLKTCGFKVNPKKTFERGPFRESCGADWFEGEDVRPLVLDFAFDSFESIAKFCNASRLKDSWNAIFCDAREFLMSLIPSNLRLVRPYRGNPDTCFEVSLDVFMSSRFARFNRKTFSWSWLELIKTSVPDVKVRKRAGYNVALMAGALKGAVSSCPFSERFTARTNMRRTSYSPSPSTWLPPMNMPRLWEHNPKGYEWSDPEWVSHFMISPEVDNAFA